MCKVGNASYTFKCTEHFHVSYDLGTKTFLGFVCSLFLQKFRQGHARVGIYVACKGELYVDMKKVLFHRGTRLYFLLL